MTLQEHITQATKLRAMADAINDTVEMLEFDLGWEMSPKASLNRIKKRLQVLRLKSRQYEDEALRELRRIALDVCEARDIGTIKRLEIRNGETLL